MIETYNAYYQVYLISAIVWRYAAAAACVCALLWVTGCASEPRTPAYLKDRAECERDAAPARGLVFVGIYNDCMRARGRK